ncbi:MAG TPA: methylmalonyl Co-A mutase-associated GTPase MeaB [Acidimicrobiia bacterium]|nr:methylmalonyl Co-A mutase-associated GTPase MeaB [Acidimicrobiia bacterium]
MLVERVLAHDRGAVARLISLVECGGPDAIRAVAQLFARTGGAYTVGVTGAPGSGKSTLSDALIARVRAEGAEIGVLAIDPTSPFSGGAILGDRVRMQDHATDPGVFIRSMATRGHLGGLALATRQAQRVLDAAGLPWVLVETVGVGQVEVDIAGAADTTVVVVNPGWGDGVQANKAGLLEIADVFVVNKADRDGVAETARDLEMMLDLSMPGAWRPPIIQTVATTGAGVDELWTAIGEHRSFVEQGGELARRRRHRLRAELRAIVVARLHADADERLDGDRFDALVERVAAREVDPYTAVDELLS